MLMRDFKKEYNVIMGSENDVCFYCLKEHQKECQDKGKDIDVVQAKNDLRSKLTYQTIFKNRNIGDGFTICKKHIIAIANEIGITPEELESEAKKAKKK